LGLKIFPDINGNGHLIEGERPQRGDIVIFMFQLIKETTLLKDV